MSPSRVFRVVRAGALSTLAGLGLGLFAAIVVPSALGGRALTVMSGSMEPAVRVGDVIVDSRVTPARVRVGDIVTFRDPEDPARTITHRVRRVRIADGTARFVTKGDTSNTVERWTIPADGTVGLVEYRIPRLGYLVFWVSGTLGRLGLVVLPALLLAALELRRIWRPRTRPLGDAAA